MIDARTLKWFFILMTTLNLISLYGAVLDPSANHMVVLMCVIAIALTALATWGLWESDV